MMQYHQQSNPHQRGEPHANLNVNVNNHERRRSEGSFDHSGRNLRPGCSGSVAQHHPDNLDFSVLRSVDPATLLHEIGNKLEAQLQSTTPGEQQIKGRALASALHEMADRQEEQQMSHLPEHIRHHDQIDVTGEAGVGGAAGGQGTDCHGGHHLLRSGGTKNTNTNMLQQILVVATTTRA